jgi:hypothetical protein
LVAGSAHGIEEGDEGSMGHATRIEAFKQPSRTEALEVRMICSNGAQEEKNYAFANNGPYNFRSAHTLSLYCARFTFIHNPQNVTHY